MAFVVTTTMMMTTSTLSEETLDAADVLERIVDTWNHPTCAIDGFLNFVPYDNFYKEVSSFAAAHMSNTVSVIAYVYMSENRTEVAARRNII